MLVELSTIIMGFIGFITLILMYPITFSWDIGSICLLILGLALRFIISILGSFVIVLGFFTMLNRYFEWYYSRKAYSQK